MNIKSKIFIALIASTFIVALTSFSLKKNQETWTIHQTTSKFTIDIPKDFSAELQEVRPSNFQTMVITGPKNLPDSEKVSIGITTSYFPSYYDSPYFKEPPQIDKLKIKLFGNSMELITKNFKDQLFVAEQILSLDNVKQGLKLELNITTLDKKGLKKAIQILKTLALNGANATPVPSIVKLNPNTMCLYNKYRLVSKYGTIMTNGKLITGSQYFYNDDKSLSKIELYQDGIYLRDSVLTK